MTQKLQRTDGLFIFIAALFVYWKLDFRLLWFFVLLLSIDVSMVGYLINNKIGAIVYNIGHSFFLPLILLMASIYFNLQSGIAFSVIWFAHIGMDRFFGFGLKIESGFRDTDMGRIGGKV